MKLKAPANSFETARIQIKTGVDELYLGTASPHLKNLAFTGRGTSFGAHRTHVSPQELKDIVALAHDNGAKVDFTANVPLMVDGIAENPRAMIDYYREHVELGIAAGVDAIIVADLGSLLLVKEWGIDLPIIASVFFMALNEWQVKMLEEMGASRVVLPHATTIEEIRCLVAKSNIEIEIFGHFGCSFISGTCSLIHSAGENVPLGVVCRGKYDVFDGEGVKIEENIPFLAAGQDCSICMLPELVAAGVASLKIVGREISRDYVTAVTMLYRRCIDAAKNGATTEEIRKLAFKIAPDLNKWACESELCKYRGAKTRIGRSLIGVAPVPFSPAAAGLEVAL